MARAGKPRPHQKSADKEENRLGSALNNYTNINTRHQAFRDEIMSIPGCDWFVDTVAVIQAKLLEMARAGEQKPRTCAKDQTALGIALSRYCSPQGRKKYKKFYNDITSVRACNWFIDIAEENRRELIRMAKAGEPKPSQHSHT